LDDGGRGGTPQAIAAVSGVVELFPPARRRADGVWACTGSGAASPARGEKEKLGPRCVRIDEGKR
jgi:hypothetical protein